MYLVHLMNAERRQAVAEWSSEAINGSSRETVCIGTRGVATGGGYIGIYTPKSVYLNFLRCCFVSLQ